MIQVDTSTTVLIGPAAIIAGAAIILAALIIIGSAIYYWAHRHDAP